MSRLGLWFGVGVAVAAIAGSVLFAARAQQVTAETNFSEAQTASDIRASVLEEERGLDGYLITGSTGELSSYFVGAHDLAAELGVARGQGRDDPPELALVAQARHRGCSSAAHAGARA
jgi:CHASE3 domain sensor protein